MEWRSPGQGSGSPPVGALDKYLNPFVPSWLSLGEPAERQIAQKEERNASSGEEACSLLEPALSFSGFVA